jgi:hypothetical protein
MRAGLVRSVAVAWVAGGLALLLVAFAGPARADGLSSLGAENIAWMGADYAMEKSAQLAGTTGSDVVTAADALKYEAAHKAGITQRVASVSGKGKLKGRAGLIVNTLIAVGSLGFIFGNEGDDALPEAVGTPSQTFTEKVGCGWTTLSPLVNTGPPGNWTVSCDGSRFQVGTGWATLATAVDLVPAGQSCSGMSHIGDAQGMVSAYFTAVVQTFRVCGWVEGGADTNHGTIVIKGTGAGEYPSNPSTPGGTADTNPDRTITQHNVCERPNNTTYVKDSTGVPFKAPNGLLVEAPEFQGLSCDAGDILKSSDTSLATAGVAGTIPLTAPYVAPDWVKQQQNLYPQCAPLGAEQCRLELWKVLPATSVLNCHTLPVGLTNPCKLWATEPNKAATYECRYAGAVLPLFRCDPYRDGFKTPTPTLRPTPDADPELPAGDPAECTSGEACSAGDEDNCFPSGWSALNPVEWVLRPTKCALTWAFVPKATALQTGLIQIQLDRAGIAPSIAALTGVVTTLGGDDPTGCMGPAIAFDIPPVHQIVTPFAACTAPMSTVAGFVYALTAIGVIVGGGFKMMSVLAAGFGFNAAPGHWEQGTLF